MNCRLEENERLFEILNVLSKGYSTGDFESLFPYLRQDCVMESQWVLTANEGYDAVTDYYVGKGETLAKSGNFPVCTIVELVGSNNPVKNACVVLSGKKHENASVSLMYTPGKLCLEMKQTNDGKEIAVILDVTLDESGMVKRIDLCMPELFKYREFLCPVLICPTVNNVADENDDSEDLEHAIRINYSDIDYLYLFMACVDEEYWEHCDTSISMDKWLAMLDVWRIFVSFQTFDEAFETLADVDYETNRVKKPWVLREFARIGKTVWDGRSNGRSLLNGLTEWTELFGKSYPYMTFFEC